MAENTKRSLFGFHGIFGVFISIFGLFFIWAILMSQAILVQQSSVKKAYDPAPIRDVANLKMRSVDNKNFAFQTKDKE
ncbi:MAG: DUF4006 family protein [Sulfurovum sp.]|nr:DUF4006 family protein [Sulfurovum sp.]